ncbi:hyaluronan and proteoglycan link protein 3 [Scleropages formosus]|uniref:Hyaluronan and proteoglycan link protein 3 n=1 Tax=Scleropages formosus TaxID=113540 RepID=A0A8C9S4G5_SCLFO|nr:hyaluronan and proteoglycan link protein 3-like [Scleropages formosus]XP_029111881.1 hyaluronan and proteoglycan link protein 3-like [Scleropages formosus]XP_029111882.1 hyaluronan and proteoglycan link protein 3-like [Scleropages formosus]XP_029111883.1 hyaluronan and proteoglycan link protein 3-like [Scleropages formosus]
MSACPLLLLLLQLLCFCQTAPGYSNGFFYHDVLNGNGNGEIYFNGVRLYVDTTEAPIFAVRGSNVTLPCRYRYEPELTSPRRTRVKWSWLPAGGSHETDVLAAIGRRHRSFAGFKGRVQLRQDSPGEVSLLLTELHLNDTGRYRCEVIDGLEDESATVDLELRGVVFPYQPPQGRYCLNFLAAQRACEEQDSALATFEQLFAAWEEGLDWCNAGWLADGTVQYPITIPREACGGQGMAPGVRNYGTRHRRLHLYDAFCFSSSLRGNVYFLQHPQKLNFSEAAQACEEDGSQIARVGQLYAAWKFTGLEHCEAGWLADGSVRYPIITPRPNCGSQEPGVRSFGFPAQHNEHGVYCFRTS